MSDSEPALASPNGVTPNFANPRDALRTVLIVTQGLCISICSIVIALRLYVRFHFRQQPGYEEYFCFIAWLAFMGYCISAIFLGQHGGGSYQWEIYKSELATFLKISYIATLFYAPMAFFVKVALLTLLARVFKPYRKWVMVIYTILGVVFAYYVPAFIIKARICSPISAYWNGTDGGGSCLNQGKVIVADSVMSVVTDLAILILPLPLTWSLQMPTEKKLKVIGLLSAGGLATGFSLYRLVMIIQDGQSPDQTMVFTRVVLTGNAEGAVGLICACLPALNAWVTKPRDPVSGSGTGTGSGSFPKKSYRSSTSAIRLSKIRRSKNDPTKVEDNKDEPGLYYSDQRTLISNAQVSRNAPSFAERSRSSLQDHAESGGIMKMVAVSQSVEVVE